MYKNNEQSARRIKEEQKEKMYESKLNFFANVTHELYTPLTLINGAVDQIRKGEINQNTRKYLSVLHNNVLSLNELIQEILDVRKIEEADINLSVLKNICLSEIFDKLLASFSVLAGQNSIEFITSVPDNLYWNTDSKGFRKIISNLLSNALKYTPVGGYVKLTVTVENNILKIVVRNSGKGIEPSKLSSIFDRNCILEETDVNANNQMTARNGLGLYICYSIVKMLKGEITVNSVVNEYTEFVITLPNQVQNEIPNTNEQPIVKVSVNLVDEDNTEKVSKIDINSVVEASVPHVLIVDDNKDIVELVADLLSPYCQTLKAFSVKEALGLLKKQTPSLVITDIMMPEIDGFSFIRMLREDKYCKRLPIIALSAKTDNLDQVKGYELGVDAYITKPFSSDVLISVVCRFLTNKVEMKNYYDSVDSSFEYIHGKLLHQKDKKFIEDVLDIIKENISNSELGPELIANQMKTSTRNLYRQMKKIIEISPTELVKDYKLSYAAKLLITTNLSVKEIIYKIGITNKSYFYNEFFKKYQLSPKQYKGMKAESEE
ncbi:response regulator [Bacteroides salyersiae]|nr:response regulator [Bacteroides salyersiae]